VIGDGIETGSLLLAMLFLLAGRTACSASRPSSVSEERTRIHMDLTNTHFDSRVLRRLAWRRVGRAGHAGAGRIRRRAAVGAITGSMRSSSRS
jgi:hypothetical protein